MKSHILGGLHRAVEDVIRNPGDGAVEIALNGAIAAYQNERHAPEPTTERAERIIAVTDDLVSKFLYYDRKESETLPMGQIEAAIENAEISVDEIVHVFREGLEKHMAARYRPSQWRKR